MTRPEFIKCRKADFRVEMIRGFSFFSFLGLFACLVIQLDRYWESRTSPEYLSVRDLGMALGIALLCATGAFVVLRPDPKRHFKCPHCNQHIGLRSEQVVKATGKCRHCNNQIIDDAENIETEK